MLNPQQNININISYNLGQDKPGKPLPGKKISKHIKTQYNSTQNPGDLEIRLNKKNTENNLKKNNETKLPIDPRKPKKKLAPPTRNTCTPDLFAERRLKTEGPSADHDLLSAFKKEGKSRHHHKSVQQVPSKPGPLGKKSTSQSKTAKLSKAGHLTSCTIPNWKKLPGEFGEHVVSQAVCPAPKRRRTQSHSAFIKNDKVVSKLLNMSMLTSELGGSQPITSERRGNPSSQSRTMKEYMSSMDMRIISSMQEDVPVFADQKKHGQPDAVRDIMSRHQISLEELTRKVVCIQRRWREKASKNVIDTYKSLFKQIVSKLRGQEKLQGISDIEMSPSEGGQRGNGSSFIFENEGLSASLKKQHIELQSDEQDFSVQSKDICWIEENEDEGAFENRAIGLNIKKYRQLVDTEVEKKARMDKSKAKEKYKEQLDQWNNVNKQITSVMNYNGSIDSQILIDELIKQSKNNQYWIDNQFEHEDPLPQPAPGTRQSLEGSLKGGADLQAEEAEEEEEEEGEEGSLEGDLGLDALGEVGKQEDSLEEEDGDEYDKNKYEPVQEQQLKEEAIVIRLKEDEVCEDEPINIVIPLDEYPDSFTSSADKPIDQVWILQQVMEDNVVRNYLDCGLGDFGIDLHSRIMQMPPSAKLEGSEGDNQDYNDSSDEAIGAKFEQANLAIIKKTLEEQPDLEPQFLGIVDAGQVDTVIDHVIRFLISQFASDISVILKKSSGGPPSDKKPVAPLVRNQGIPTNFNSIKDYLSKFIVFITKQERTVQKIVDTINKDIGPSSLEILTYLRPEPEDSNLPYALDQEEQSFDDDEGLFVVPAELFEEFEAELEQKYKSENQKDMGPRLKAFLSFWHRCIFQSYNECLDYERPYGIEGKPYEWTTQTKIFRKIRKERIGEHLARAQSRLSDLTMMVGGLIYEKVDSPFAGADLSEEQKHMMNEQRLSRILATELLESEQSWVNYNDEMAELLVELSRMIEDKLFFEYGTELKKLQRRRKIIADQSSNQESVVFNVDEL